MLDPALTHLLKTLFLFAICGAVVSVVARMLNRKNPGPSLDQAATIGALVGAGFGALVGIFSAMLSRL